MPKVGLLLVTTPLRMMPFTQILPLATHRPTSTGTPLGTGVAVSTNDPPRLVLDRLPQIGVGEPCTLNSTATKHFIRGYCLRSCPQDGVNISGSNGGEASGEVATGATIDPVEAAARL